MTDISSFVSFLTDMLRLLRANPCNRIRLFNLQNRTLKWYACYYAFYCTVAQEWIQDNQCIAANTKESGLSLKQVDINLRLRILLMTVQCACAATQKTTLVQVHGLPWNGFRMDGGGSSEPTLTVHARDSSAGNGDSNNMGWWLKSLG